MNKHMKKIMSVLIAGAMAVSSLGLTALADEDIAPAPAAEATPAPAEATEAPAEATATPAVTAAPAEATATPAATAAPTTGVNGAYESDNYYKEALSLVSALGIITGYEDGSVRPTESVTRSQMAAIILRLKNTPESSTYSGVFTDVTSTAWYASAVQTAYDLGIINGYGDGKFGPEDPVTYEQVYKMLVCAHNRGGDAENFGGYPAGYMQAGNTLLKLNDKVSGTMGTNADRGLVIKLVYNALLADYAAPNGTDDLGNPKYEVKDTLAAEIFDVYDSTAIVYGTSKKALIGKELNDGELAIKDLENKENGYDYEIVDYSLTNADDMLGYKVNYFYKQDNYGNKNVISMTATSKTTELVIEATDIDTFDSSKEITYEYDNSSRTKTAKLDKEVQIVYNGQIITDKTDFGGEEKDDFLKPELGEVKLIDNDGDNEYDVMIISKSFQMLIASVSQTKVNGKVNGVTYSGGIDIENESGDKTITTIVAGEELKPKAMKKNDVAIVTISPDGKVIDFVVTRETMTGQVSSQKTNSDDEQVVTIDGKEYIVDKNTEADISLGVSATFYLDSYGRIGYIDNSVSSGKLTGNEKYGWISRISYDSDTESYTVRMYDVASGKLEDYTFANSMTFWPAVSNSAYGWSNTKTVKLSGSDDWQKLVDLYKAEFTVVGNAYQKDKLFVTENAYKVQLCKYQVNSNGELTKMFLAVKGDVESDGSSTPCTFDEYVDSAVGQSDLMNGKYNMTEEAIEMYVPKEYEDRNLLSAYSVGNVTPSNYLPRDSSSVKAIVAEVDGNKPYMIIRFNESATAANTSIADDGFSANDNNTFMISDVSRGIDDDDNEIFVLTGYTAGEKVTYKTTSTTTLYNMESNVAIFNGNRQYSHKSIWNAADATSTDIFIDNVKTGDVFVLSTTGSNIKGMLKVGDADYIAKERKPVWTGRNSSVAVWQSYGMSSREGWLFGRVKDIDYDEFTTVTLGDPTTGSQQNSIKFAPSKTMTVYEIFYKVEDGNRVVTNTKLHKDSVIADDLTIYDESTGEGDMILAKGYRGGLRDMYVYRFTRV